MRRQRAFSLVELLFVIAIIAILISIILPTMNRAREQSNRVICTSNLRDLGMASMQFADEHQGFFPMAFMEPSIGAPEKYPYRFPVAVSLRTPESEQSAAAGQMATWTYYGTPFATFEKFGMRMKNWRCPSASYCEVQSLLYSATPPTATAEWGDFLWTHYMYVGGMTLTNMGKSIPNWGKLVPATKNVDADRAQRILAADMVFFSGGEGYLWDSKVPRYMFNHRKGDGLKPVFQNILYGDGRVEGKGPEYYPDPLTVNNHSMAHCTTPLVGGFFYWGTSGSGAPLTDSAPPTLLERRVLYPTYQGPPGSGGSGSGSPPTPPAPPSAVNVTPITPTPVSINRS